MAHVYKVPLLLAPQSEGGYTVTSPILPEFLTEGDTISDALAHVQDAIQAVVELYDDLGKTLPPDLARQSQEETISFEFAVAVP